MGPSAEGVGPYTGTQLRELLLALGHPGKVTLGTAPLPDMGLEKRGKVRNAREKNNAMRMSYIFFRKCSACNITDLTLELGAWERL